LAVGIIGQDRIGICDRFAALQDYVEYDVLSFSAVFERENFVGKLVDNGDGFNPYPILRTLCNPAFVINQRFIILHTGDRFVLTVRIGYAEFKAGEDLIGALPVRSACEAEEQRGKTANGRTRMYRW
jgi:hypothetical protein